jgi:hypothetical protein
MLTVTNNAIKKMNQKTSAHFDKEIINERLSRFDNDFLLIDWIGFY